ncbi:MAG: hypothetical protein FK734_00350 [Asgard group archaeon]|nr:hypothetical protein [Asgard group archaeon]
MLDYEKLLLELDKCLFDTFNENKDKPANWKKTDYTNAAGHKSLEIDLIMEDGIINFLRDKNIPCVLEAEERGRTNLSNNPEYLFIVDPLDGSNNFKRKIPLCCYGIAIAPIVNNKLYYSNIEAAAVRSFLTNEFFIAEKHKGAKYNGKKTKLSTINKLEQAIVAFDLDHTHKNSQDVINNVMTILRHCAGSRRFGANLLDMVYVASGKIEVMIDIRNRLSAVHTSGLFIAEESGAIIRDVNNRKFDVELRTEEKMSFILCNNENLLTEILVKIQNE